ncbi:TPA: serine O-acetyltransferase [Vibrio vulnificus]
MFKNIKFDYLAFLGGTRGQNKPPFTFIRHFSVIISFEFVIVLFFRLYSFLFGLTFFRFLGLMLYHISKYIFKCDIHPAANIGPGFHLVHGFNVVIGADATLGKNVCLFDGVSLGKKNVGTPDGMPYIGDDVIIGSGAKVLGSIVVGKGVIIGANSVVIRTVDIENVTVAGIPAKILQERK